jgi:protein-disulfide isomerase
MASGKQSKRRRAAAAAAPPPVRKKGARPGPRPGGRQASPRVLIAAAAAIVLVAVAIVLGFLLTGDSSSSDADVPQTGSLTNALPGAAEVEEEFRGIPQAGNVLGSPSAPVTLIEWVDLQCPFCQQFAGESLPTILADHVRTGKVKIELRTLAFIGPDSERGRDALIAAGEQNKLFNFQQLLYTNQGPENTGWLDDDFITRTAASIPGVDVPRLLEDRNSDSVRQAGEAFDEQAAAAGVQSTPTVMVGTSAETAEIVQMSSPTDTEAVVAAITAALP